MGTTTAVRTTPNAVDLHAGCWRILSRASAAGCEVSYLPAGQPVPAGAALVGCLVCSDRWIVSPAWLSVLRRGMLAVAISDVAAGSAV
jgi:hypothetical protein